MVAEATGQAIADRTQGIGVSHLAKQHRRQLRPTGKTLGMAFPLVLFDQTGKFVPGDLLEKLTEKAGRLYHESALRGFVGKRIVGPTQFSRDQGGPRQSYTCLGQE
jgi:hypothetical protein